MKAFNGDQKLKEGLVREVNAHRLADRLIHGTYGADKTPDKFKGCAVGCSIHSYNKLANKNLRTNNHGAYEEFGIPRILAKIEDGIFEGLSRKDAQEWPVLFMNAVPVGADLSGVWAKFAQWLLTDSVHGVIRYAKTDEQKKAIQRVSDLYAKGKKATKEEFKKAARACRTAAAYVAAAAAAAYAAYVAAAREKARRFQAEKLLELLRSAPVRKEKKAA